MADTADSAPDTPPESVEPTAPTEPTATGAQTGPMIDPSQPVQVALRWLIEQEGITCILPDARSAHQVRFNIEAAGIAPLGAEMHAALAELYDRIIRPYVHDRW